MYTVVIDFVMRVKDWNDNVVTCICSGDSAWELDGLYDVHKGDTVKIFRKNNKFYLDK